MSKLIPIEHKSQRVLTTQQLAYEYETDSGHIKQNYSNNRNRYILGIHYFILEGDELKRFKSEVENFDLAPNVNRFFLWTEKGSLLHAKSLNTDKAWEVYQELVDTYFRAIQLAAPGSQIQILQQAINVLAEQEKQLSEIKAIAIEAKTGLDQAREVITSIKDTILNLPVDKWREWVSQSLNTCVRSEGCEFSHESIRNESYTILERKSGSDLSTRVRNRKKRLSNAGATKAVINTYCKLDAIEEDKRLKEIYTNIVKEFRIKYIA